MRHLKPIILLLAAATGQWVLYGAGLAAALAATIVIARAARKALGESVDLDRHDEDGL